MVGMAVVPAAPPGCLTPPGPSRCDERAHEADGRRCSIADVSRTLAVVLAGGEGERLSLLSGVRAKPAVPFGGKYRIIDFTLSNCVNSGITNVIVLTQYAPLSLNDHIGAGRPWDLDRNVGGIRILQPFVARGRAREWYRGTADAVATNLDAIHQSGADIVLILAGDHIYKMDYGPFIQQHRRRRADVTIAVKPVPHRGGPSLRGAQPGRQRCRHRVAGEAASATQRPGQPGHLRLLPQGPGHLAGWRA